MQTTPGISNMGPIPAFGIESRHEKDFVINRPSGLEDYVFVYFLDSVQVTLADEVCHLDAGTCLLYSPGYPQFYHGQDTGLANDWFHATKDFLSPLLNRYNVPANTVIRPRHPDRISYLLRQMEAELNAPLLYAERAITLVIEQLILELARSTTAPAQNRLSPRKTELLERFIELRKTVRGEPAHNWRLEELAEIVNLSASRCTALYREFFGISPMEDVIRTRLSFADWLLAGTDLTVTEVAEQCGFANIYYFSRLFRQKTGRSPSEARRRYG